jgi:hypothetical protein
MKTSNKLILSALIILLVSIGIYNNALKAEFLTGNYKSPFRDYTALNNIKDFDAIQVNASNQMQVKITNGDSKVWVSKFAADRIKITQKGKTLILDLAYDKDNNWLNNVIISCPKLVSVKTYAFYMDGNKKVIENDKHGNDGYYGDNWVEIQGFKQDSLTLQQDNYSKIKLEHNQINSLKAIEGITLNAEPLLSIAKNNTIQNADLQINQKSQLELNNVYIPQLRTHFSDSAKVSFSGVALKNLNKQ